jgi:KDO2-lipid IV(A) lauroyltransferase
VRNVVLAWLIERAGRLLGVLPLGAAVRVGGALGAGAYRMLGRDRRRALEHLAIALPELGVGTHARLARETFCNAGRSFAELAQWPHLRERMGELISIDGVDHLERGLAAGRGVIAVTGHIGNWELLAAAVARLGYRLNVVARRVNEDRFDRLISTFRMSAGVRTIKREEATAMRDIVRGLRAGGILALLIDQDTRGPGVFVPFFGRPARTSPGAATIALRTRAPVLAVFIERRPPGHHVRFQPLYGFDEEDDRRPTVEELTAKFTAAIEAQIRHNPSEWVWWHRRWRHQPPPGTSPPG